MKIICRWCGSSKHCHKIGKEKIIDYDSEHGTDRVTKIRVKIHKHHKGEKYCLGSDKIIMICLEDEKYRKGYEE